MNGAMRSDADEEPAADAGQARSERLRALLFPDARYSAKKYEDHRQFTAVVLGILGVFLASLWGWDYLTDPVGAQRTIGLRLCYLLILPLAYAFWARPAHRRLLVNAMPLSLLLGEAVFIEILNRLENGMNYGIAGFMYVMFIAVLTGQAQSLRRGFAYTLAATVLPEAMALAGLLPGFPHVRYAILLWPAAGLTMLAQLAFAANYLRRYQLEEQLLRLSDTDPLSGTANRRCFMRVLEHELKRARRQRQALTLLVLDIDHFKRINDAYGHPSGDRVIRHVAQTCAGKLRSIDLLGRIGGEEYAVLLPATPLDRGVEVAERLRAQIAASTVDSSAGTRIGCTVSIGVAELGAADTQGGSLFARADAALYVAKDAGRNRVAQG